jgi:hypothetical protein
VAKKSPKKLRQDKQDEQDKIPMRSLSPNGEATFLGQIRSSIL